MSVYLITLLIIYFVVLIGITYLSRMDREYQGFVIGERKVGLWSTVSSLAANWRDGSGMVIWITLSALFGFGALWLAAGFFTAFLIIAWQAPKIRKEAEKYNYITLGDLFNHRVGPWLNRISAVIIAIAALLYASGNLYVAGTLTSVVMDMSPAVGIFAVASFVAFYLSIGGYMTVIRTDLFQGFLLFFIAVIVFITVEAPPVSEALTQFIDFSNDMKVGFFVLVGMFAYASADHWQRLFSTKSPQIARKSFLIIIPFYAVIVIGIILFGLAMHGQFPDVQAGDLYFGLFEQESLSPLFIAVLGLFTLTAAMSTLDTQTFLFASTVMKVLGYSEKTEHARFVNISRIVMVGLLLVMAVVASFIGNIVSFLVDAVTVFIVLAPVLFYVTVSHPVRGKFRDCGLASALVLGFFIHTTMFFTGMFDKGILYNLIPVGTTTGITVIVALLTYYRVKSGQIIK